VTLTAPLVETRICPFESNSTASTSSAFCVKPTSEPSKCIEKMPAVKSPSEVAVKRTMSESSMLRGPGSVPATSKERRRVVALAQEKASMRKVERPTSEPSKARLKAVPSKKTTSSSAALTVPTVPALRSEK